MPRYLGAPQKKWVHLYQLSVSRWLNRESRGTVRSNWSFLGPVWESKERPIRQHVSIEGSTRWLHCSSHCTFHSPAPGFSEPGTEARRASGNHRLLLKPVLRGISPTSVIAHSFSVHQTIQALITIAVNYNLPICLLAPCPTAFILAVLFLRCLLPAHFLTQSLTGGRHMIWWGGRRKAQFPFSN